MNAATDTQVVPPTSDTPRSSRRALVVDDHEDSAASLAMMLTTMGYETDVASDGVAALRKANELQPDMVLLDINMPKLDGYDACSVIRSQPWAKNVRLIAVTGYEKATIGQRSSEAGFDDYLLKPVEFEVLKKLAGKYR
jgi:CheY-like chemotaxis protein